MSSRAIFTCNSHWGDVQSGNIPPELEEDRRSEHKHGEQEQKQAKSTFKGHSGTAAGGHSQRRPNSHTTTLNERTRNTNRGLRSRRATVQRNEDRTSKRREARSNKRQENAVRKGGRMQSEKRTKERRASAQEPRARGQKLGYGQDLWIATLNMRGSKTLGKREEIERWMKENKIAILSVQETHVGVNAKETRDTHTWYFSGEEKCRIGYTAGVGFVIDNDYIQYIDDIEPVNDRLCVLRLRHAAPITLLAVYIPQALRPEEEKEEAYDILTKYTRSYVHKGPTYVLGDFNARVQARITEEEAEVIGPHTFEKESANPFGRSDEVVNSRQLFINFLINNNMKAMNTYFQKGDQRLVTFREIGTTRDEPIQRGTHEQIDFIVTPNRWKNTVKDVESDHTANINSDHYPVIARIRAKLKAIHRGHKNRPKYDKCDKAQKEKINNLLQDKQSLEAGSSTRYIKALAAIAKENLPKLPKKEKKTKFSTETQDILDRRREATRAPDANKFDRLTTEFRKSKKRDNRGYVIDTLSSQLDSRDRWAGIRALRNEYQPNPYHRKKSDGSHIPKHRIAEEAAKHLAENQWGSNDNGELADRSTERIVTEEVRYDVGEIRLMELQKVVRKFKRRKSPGPDDVPMEIFKEMDEESLQSVLNILNQWWLAEKIEPEEALFARVVLLYKKGDTSKMENYRPISLLNSIYKIFAAIVHNRLADKLDKFLQKMQFGFRKGRGTADAIHCVRRAAEHGEQTKTKTRLVLLDWEKAFDKVTREGLYSALERMAVDSKIQRVIKALYKKPMFKVETDGIESNWHEQKTGIRQGCPLSPYLFLVVMTVMFHDVHKLDSHTVKMKRIPGADFDEVLYADDTICMSTDTKVINRTLANIEREGAKYGLKLNRQKCEVLHTGDSADVHFIDGVRIQRKTEVKYLGCILNDQADVRKEVSARIAACMVTLKKLDIFWRHSDCPERFKIQALDAVLRSKLLYGLETAELGSPLLNKLDVFQLKGLRKILRLNTTFVNRANTNKVVMDTANAKIKQQGGRKEIKQFSLAYKEAKKKRAIRIIRADSDDPQRQMTFERGLKPWNHANKRVGAPKTKWATEAVRSIWNEIRQTQSPPRTTQAYNPNSPGQENIIKNAAMTGT